jgi:hypothetical protein
MYILLIIIFLAVIYKYLIYIYNNPQEYKLDRSGSIEGLLKFNIQYFIKNFGKHKIFISYSPSNVVDMDTQHKKINLEEYIKNYKNYKNWYFKTENEYDFLNEIGIKDEIISLFKKTYNLNYELHRRLSFWMGNKGTTTGYHTDLEDITYLYIIEGKKKIILIEPEYTKYMYVRNKYYFCSLWSKIDFKNVDYQEFPLFKNVKQEEIILEKGDCLMIPRNWWHAVENLEDTIGISYKIYRPQFIMFGLFPEVFRFIYKFYYNCRYSK